MSAVPTVSFTSSDGHVQAWALTERVTIIGRKPPAHIVLPYSSISRRHAQIEQRDFGYYLTDLGSRNGTFINGSPATEPTFLKGGDQLVLGGIVALTFNDPDETAVGERLGRLQGVWIDPLSNAVWIDSVPVEPPLSPSQLALLRLLYEHENVIVSREQVVATIWPEDDPAGISGEAVDGLIKRLRKRLRRVQPAHEYVDVVRGHGLRLRDPFS